MRSEPFELTASGVRLFVKLTPKAAADRIEAAVPAGGGRVWLKVGVAAPPEKGKANRALQALIAGRLGVAKNRVRVTAGETSRLKTLEIEGAPHRLADGVRAHLLGGNRQSGTCG